MRCRASWLEIFGGLRVIRSTANERGEAAAFLALNETQARAEGKMVRSSTVLLGAVETLGVAGAMALTAGSYTFLVAPGVLTVSEFFAFSFALLRLLPMANQAYGLQAQIASMSGSVEQVLHWLELPTYPSRPFGTSSLSRLTDGIELQQLTFRYGEGRRVLDGAVCRIPAGATVAIVGPSGAGKTTLFSLLLRQRELDSGRILFDGRDHWDFAPGDYHQNVAVVEQDPYIFNASVAENVAYGVPGSAGSVCSRRWKRLA